MLNFNDKVMFWTRNAIKNQSKRYNFKNGTRLCKGSCAQPFQSLQERCIPSLESFEHMVSLLRPGQKCSEKIKGFLSKKHSNAELRFLCTAPRVIARNMHTTFGVIWIYGDKITLRQGILYKINQRARIKKRNKDCLLYCA